MAKEKRTEVVTLRLKPSTKEGLQMLAEADRRPFATFLAMILEDYFDAQADNEAANQKRIIDRNENKPQAEKK